jgi:hypothetical protein
MELWAVDRATTLAGAAWACGRMVVEVRPDYPSDCPEIVAVASRLGIGSAETPRKWVR